MELVVQEGPFTSSSQIASVVTGKAITFELTIVKRRANPRKQFLHLADVNFIGKPESLMAGYNCVITNNFSTMTLKMVCKHMLVCAFLFPSRSFSAERPRLWTLRSEVNTNLASTYLLAT